MSKQCKAMLPWWGRIAAKIVLSRLPVDYRFWQRIGLFRHGSMDQAEYAIGVFETHLARANLPRSLSGKTILELGPGDSVSMAIIAAAHGARAILVDAGLFANVTPAVYRDLARALRKRGLVVPHIADCDDLRSLLTACGARYFTAGLESLEAIEDRSVDLIFSQAVLEHVRAGEFLQTQRELMRILKPDGVCSHRVDLRDHLGGSLNNLRFSRRLWESPFFVHSGFYTNRIRFDAMLRIFEEVGFEVDPYHVERWEHVPIERRQLALEFRQIPDEILNVSGFNVLCRRSSIERSARAGSVVGATAWA